MPVRIEDTPGPLQRVSVSTPLAEADAYPHGAHIAHWTPSGQKPVLFCSSKSAFLPGKAIRGGVPLIFPWFGNRPEGAHGYARTKIWELDEAVELPDGRAQITFLLKPEHFDLRFRVTIGSTLSMEFQATNRCDDPQTVEMALHTYLAVSDIDAVTTSGLDATEYIDKVDSFAKKKQAGDIRITGETDRVYLNTTSSCQLHDTGWHRVITVEKTGSNSTVVWNPWSEKAAGMSDMGEGEWRGMICIETANAADNAVTIPPGASHTMTAHISVTNDS